MAMTPRPFTRPQNEGQSQAFALAIRCIFEASPEAADLFRRRIDEHRAELKRLGATDEILDHFNVAVGSVHVPPPVAK